MVEHYKYHLTLTRINVTELQWQYTVIERVQRQNAVLPHPQRDLFSKAQGGGQQIHLGVKQHSSRQRTKSLIFLSHIIIFSGLFYVEGSNTQMMS